jgi:UDP-N-acetylmuramate--alanine ligase
MLAPSTAVVGLYGNTGSAIPAVSAARYDSGMDVHLIRRAHLVGIAGAGMSSLARVLSDWGWRLSGSDPSTDLPAWMADAGLKVARGHAAENLPADAELLIASDAIGPENPERQAAIRRGLPVMSYFDLLGQLTTTRHTLAVAGTHGKSTTTAMVAAILRAAGIDPTVIGGGIPVGADSGGCGGQAPWMVVEACEYRANFLKLRPQAAAILNLEADHFDYYRTAAQLDAAFAAFAGLLPPNGTLVVNYAPRPRAAAAMAHCPSQTFGLDPEADWSVRRLTADRGYYRGEIWHQDRPLGELRLRVPGRHNVLNALGAAALAVQAGASDPAILAGLNEFPGIRRRLQCRGVWHDAVLLDDYAHHPTEVKATIGTVRQMYPSARLWCVFQPHQASRTAALLDEFADSLQNTDVAVVAEIFRAREAASPTGEVTAADLAARIRTKGGAVLALHHREEIAAYLRDQLRPGDVLLTLGAGDIGKLHEVFT